MQLFRNILFFLDKTFKTKILTKYVFKQLISGVFVITVILASIAWLTQILKLLKYVLERGLSFGSFIFFTSLLLPQIISLVLPIAFFAVIIFIYNKLIQDKEFVVMCGSGASRYQLAKPVFLAMIFLTCFSYFSTLYLEPVAAVKFKSFQWNIRNDLSTLAVKEDQFVKIKDGLTIYVEKSASDALYNILIFDNRTAKQEFTVFAKKGQFVQTDNGMTIALSQGSVQEKNKDGKFTFGFFEEYSINLGLMEEQQARKANPKELGLKNLFNPKKHVGEDKRKEAAFKMEAHRRILMPLFHIIFALIALIGIFSSSLTARGKNKSLIVASFAFICTEGLLIFLMNFFESHINLIPFLYLFYFSLIAVLVFIFFLDSSKAKLMKGKK